MSSISGVSGSSSAWAAVSAQRAQHQAKMFAKVDTDSSSGVDQTELSSLLSDVASKTGASLGDSQELFTKMDSNADGSLSSDELGKGMKDLMPSPSTMDFAQSRGMGGSNGSQDHLFSKVDTDSDGAVSQDELQVLTDKIKSKSGRDVSQDFSQLDADGSGSLSQAEFDAGRPQPPEGAAGPQGAQGPGGPSGPPPSGGPGGPGGAGKTESSSTTYDPLDTNQDGTVSEMERMVGELQEAVANLASSRNASGNTTTNQQIAELAQKIYAQVAEGLTDSTRTLSTSA
ncbi:MAG: XopAW family type III secretion system calcium-binding effector [Rhodoferax sp.]|uniref:XopAW family type III secretion system calcium-binding effector n=1 Tax=Rhodoferax sp. TaxID=50421 RepID=UPI002ACED4D3|nr:XopAW family type III secretion system calcium-binding effector [Rhodoferax sp.]MDZ7891517.1 XopAW family type III secretion system calcium-binding effector [Rhodoferax sp.]